MTLRYEYDQVLEILQKYNGDFPPLLSNVVKNNFNYYGKLIKEICKKAKLNDEIKTLQYKSAKNNSGVVKHNFHREEAKF